MIALAIPDMDEEVTFTHNSNGCIRLLVSRNLEPAFSNSDTHVKGPNTYKFVVGPALATMFLYVQPMRIVVIKFVKLL